MERGERREEGGGRTTGGGRTQWSGRAARGGGPAQRVGTTGTQEAAGFAATHEELRHRSTGSSIEASKCSTLHKAFRRAASSSWSNSRLKRTNGIWV